MSRGHAFTGASVLQQSESSDHNQYCLKLAGDDKTGRRLCPRTPGPQGGRTHTGACFQEGGLDCDAIKRDAPKGAVTGENHTPGQGTSQFPSLFPDRLLWALGHVDSTEPRETLTMCPS